MTRKINRLTEGITRRTALKTGVAVSSGLAFGGTMIGTVRANPKAESENIIPVDLFVRPDGTTDQEPTAPAPTCDDLLVQRTQGIPVDDGTDPDDVDGEMGQLTWNQFSDISGEIKVECDDGGTSVRIKANGLLPGALYTAWVVVFEYPGFDPTTRKIEKAIQNMVGFAPLGDDTGSENVFRPNDDGEGKLEVFEEPTTFPEDNLGQAGQAGEGTKECLFDHFEVHLIGGWHLDDQNQNPSFRPNAVEQFAFIIKDGDFL